MFNKCQVKKKKTLIKQTTGSADAYRASSLLLYIYPVVQAILKKKIRLISTWAPAWLGWLNVQLQLRS